MKTRRPLGWWDSRTSRTPSKRCANERDRILATLAGLKHRADYNAVCGFAHSLLNLAASFSESGDDEQAKALQKTLHGALKKLGNASLSAAAAMKEITG